MRLPLSPQPETITQGVKMFSVTAGPFAVVDADGNALCHSPRQNRTVNSRVRREVKAAWLEALMLAGLAGGECDGDCGLQDDGSTRECGVWVLCVDGKPRLRGCGQDARDGFADFGHVIADAHDGAFCMCNAVPVEGSQNRDNGDARQAIGWTRDQMDDYASAVRAVASRRMTGTKRARIA